MDFRIVTTIVSIETIAIGQGIREIEILRRCFGPGRWRKMKGKAWIELANGRRRFVEIHWYEAHGIGRVRFKIKRKLP